MAPVDLAQTLPAGAPRRRLSTPLLVALLAVVAIAAGWHFTRGAGGDGGAAAQAGSGESAFADRASSGNFPPGTSWADAVPKQVPVGDFDALTLSESEVSKARFAHQLELVRDQMKRVEQLYVIRVQADGTLVALVAGAGPSRWIASKQDLQPEPTLSAASLQDARPLGAAAIQTQVPAKLVRAAIRADGFPPGKLLLQHPSTGAFGDAPVWSMVWPAEHVRLWATADGHDIKV